MSSSGQSHNNFIESVFVKNFRNVRNAQVQFGKRNNLFIGPNGHGKTNCLEAIALACSLRPMQSLKNADLIHHAEAQAKIMAKFGGDVQAELEIDIFLEGKRAKLNKKPIKNTASLIKSYPLVTFIPAELSLVCGAQSLRRRVLDQAAASLFFEHILSLRAYEKLLLHRNRLLKDWPLDRATLKTFTDLLIEEGSKIIYLRLKTIEHMLQLFSMKIHEILGQGSVGNIRYQCQNHVITTYTLNDLRALLAKERSLSEPSELKRRITLFGPHLDDVIFEINGKNAKNFASRGQARAIVLSFKLAHMMAITKISGRAPIVILDDIVSELDQERKANLIDAINDLDAQAFFSTTDLMTFGRNNPCDEIFYIDNGEINSGRLLMT